MKKILAVLLCCMTLMLSSISVFAAETGDAPDTTITSGTTDETGSAVNAGSQKTTKTIAAGTNAQPIDVRIETIGGAPYITKVYELAGAGSALPDASDFEQDGFTFTKSDAFQQQQPDDVETREATKTKTVSVTENTQAAVTAAAEPDVSYSEDGFSGKLQLSASDTTFEEVGTTSYTYRVTDVREYDTLDRNDLAYVPKTVTKNGVPLTLEDVEWVVMGTTPSGDSLVPNLFKAVASYSGTATGTKVSGYTATVTYSGTVKKTTPGKLLYTVVFRGEPIVVEEIAAETQPAKPSIWPTFLIVFGALVALGGAGFGVFYFIRRKRLEAEHEEEIEDLVEKGEW